MSEKSECEFVEMGVRLPNGGFKRNIFVHKDSTSTVRKRYKNKGVYISAYEYTKPDDKANSLLIGDMYIDLDHNGMKEREIAAQAFEEIRQDAIKSVSFFSAIFGIPEDMIRIYYSGQKGVHIVIPREVLGLQPSGELNEIFRLIALEVARFSHHKTVDTQIYDNARLFSIPGGIHPETGRYKTPITYDELRTISYRDLLKLSKTVRYITYEPPTYSTKANRLFKSYIESWEKEKQEKAAKSGKKGKGTLNFCPPCIKSILTRPCVQGGRNNTTAALVSYFKQRGYSEARAWGKLQEWNDNYAKLSKRELETTFKSVFSREYTYGCSTLEQLGDCQKNNCKIGKNR